LSAAPAIPAKYVVSTHTLAQELKKVNKLGNFIGLISLVKWIKVLVKKHSQ